jgi:hypothetical protein
LVHILTVGVLCDHGGKNVRNRLIESPGLKRVDELGSVLSHTVSQLVGRDVQKLAQTSNGFSVTITKKHLIPIPMGVGVTALQRMGIVMDAADEVEALVIYRTAVEHIEEKVVCFTKVVVHEIR